MGSKNKLTEVNHEIYIEIKNIISSLIPVLLMYTTMSGGPMDSIKMVIITSITPMLIKWILIIYQRLCEWYLGIYDVDVLLIIESA